MMLPTDATSYPLLRQRHSLDIFVCMVVVSLLLHLAVSVIVTLPGRFAPSGAPPLFLEMRNLVEAPPPGKAPVEEAADKPAPAPAPETMPEQGSEQTPEVAKLQNAVESSLRKAVQAPEAVHESSIGLGMTSGHFASFADGVTLKDEIRVYYFALMRRVNEAWWLAGAAKGSFANSASINLLISRDGKVVGCELLESSGNREQDQALLAAVKGAEPLPPLPPSYVGPTFNAPIRFVPPLQLMLPGFGGKGKLLLQHGE
jgi:protein TonB